MCGVCVTLAQGPAPAAPHESWLWSTAASPYQVGEHRPNTLQSVDVLQVYNGRDVKAAGFNLYTCRACDAKHGNTRELNKHVELGCRRALGESKEEFKRVLDCERERCHGAMVLWCDGVSPISNSSILVTRSKTHRRALEREAVAIILDRGTQVSSSRPAHVRGSVEQVDEPRPSGDQHGIILLSTVASTLPVTRVQAPEQDHALDLRVLGGD